MNYKLDKKNINHKLDKFYINFIHNQTVILTFLEEWHLVSLEIITKKYKMK